VVRLGIMEETKVRGEPLGPIGRLRVRFGRCPECGGQLAAGVSHDFASSTWVREKWMASCVGSECLQSFELVQRNDRRPSRRCTACERWYVGKWAYREVDELARSA
jgi:hypothetical protein